MNQSCKTCKHLVVPLTAAGRRVVYRDVAYKCGFPMPALPAMPSCWTLGHSHGSIKGGFEHVNRTTWAANGADCETYEALK